MAAAIELDDDLVSRSVKIDYIWADTMLSAKLRAANRRSRSNPHKWRSGIVEFFRSSRARARIWADADLDHLGSFIREFRRILDLALRETTVRAMLIARVSDRQQQLWTMRRRRSGAPLPGPLPVAAGGRVGVTRTWEAPHPGPLPAGRGSKSGCRSGVARPSPRPSPRGGERE